MSNQHHNDKRAEKAARDLKRVTEQADTIGTSAMARMAKRAGDRLNASDIDQDDAIEIWGTRIGRGLGLIAFIALSIYLFVVYVLP